MTRPNILIVDDEEDIRLNLMAALSAEGYDIRLAATGAEALDMVKERRPDLVMLDVMMPDMDGYELCKRMKEDYGLKNVGVVFASALRKTRDRVEGLDRGADDYITKPFNMPELMAKIRAHLRMSEYKKQLERLAEFARSLNSIELDRISAAVSETLPDLLPSDRFSLFMLDGQENNLRLLAHNYGGEGMDNLLLPLESSPIMAEALKNGVEILVEDFQASPYSTRSKRARYNDGYAFCAPVMMGGEALGVLNLNGNGQGFFSRMDMNVARLVTETLAATLLNHRRHMEINRLAITDGLTKLFNHRHFYERLTQEFERTRRFHQDLTCVMIDVDHFKKINDTYGHLAGDVILKHIADKLAAHLRKIDLVARYGGEEFSILLPQTDTHAAEAVAERIRQDVASSPAETGAGPVTVTISIGICSANTPGVTKVDDLVRMADEALYQAKRAGRDKTLVYGAGN
ncbi:MAG: diguanylate cyclase [Nitrospinae bacterium]|nr:diguanylate cyclase [Nitrospinota bacterium]